MTTTVEEMKYYHAIGYRDAVANLCLLVRDKGPQEALREMAEWLQKADPENPHAPKVLEMLAKP